MQLEKSYITEESIELLGIAEDLNAINKRLAKMDIAQETTYDLSRYINQSIKEAVKAAANVISDNLIG
jgi:hypothetical protein